MITPEQLEQYIAVLPKVVLYIAPGYVTLSIYHSSRDGRVQDTLMTAIKCMFLSYIYVTIATGVAGILDVSDARLDSVTLLLVVALAVIAGGVANSMVVQKIIQFIMINFYRTTRYTNLMDDIRGLSRDGSSVHITAYLNEGAEKYDGYLVHDRMHEQFDKYIILDSFRRYVFDNNTGKYHVKDNFTTQPNPHQWLVYLEMKKVTRLEFYIEDLARKDNSLSGVICMRSPLELDQVKTGTYKDIKNYLLYGKKAGIVVRLFINLKGMFSRLAVSEETIEAEYSRLIDLDSVEDSLGFYTSFLNYFESTQQRYDSSTISLLVAFAAFMVASDVQRVLDNAPPMFYYLLLIVCVIIVFDVIVTKANMYRITIIRHAINRKISVLRNRDASESIDE